MFTTGIKMTEFKEFHKKTLSESVSYEFLEMIKAKKIIPGQKLPPERELAEMMNISRPSLREALRALAIMNIVEIRQGDGTYVSSLEPKILIEYLEFVFALDDSTVLQLFDARKIVEPGTAELAAEYVQESDIKELTAINSLSTQYENDFEKFIELDLKLHNKIIEIARNPILSRFNSSLQQLTAASRRRTGLIQGVIPQTVKDHDAIVHAIINRKPQEAREAMLNHLNFVEKSFRGLISKQEKELNEKIP